VLEGALALGAPVIVVDDGSSDGTRALARSFPVTLLVHEQRRGKGEALRRGFAEALRQGADAVVTMDGDGQHAAEDVPRLVAAHARDPRALILCSRSIERGTQPRLRRFANHFADFWISWACGQRVLDSQCGQRLYPRALLEALPPSSAGGFAFESEVLIEAARQGFPIASVAIRARYHAGRRASHFRPLLDALRITATVGRRILARGLFLPGLVRSLRQPALRLDP
jgi:glycosyltransferase involved in cell wall biosynthesis